MGRETKIRRALPSDALAVNDLLSEWFEWTPDSGRLTSVKNAIANGELIVADKATRVIGFIHCVMHGDIIDGGPSSFITAFYVSPKQRGKGVGSQMLDYAIKSSLSRGALGVETSTIHRRAKRHYEKHHFNQTMGDIAEVFLELDIPQYQLRHGLRTGIRYESSGESSR